MSKIQIIAEPLPGLLLLQPKVFSDSRGYFMESYNKKDFEEIGLDVEFVQDNQALSGYGVIRGLHYQMPPYAQTKLVRVLKGKILDVALDIRKNSPTFGQYFIIELSDENFLQLLIPKGFAHGYSVLEDNTVVFYKTDEFYHPEAEEGIYAFDPELGIDWGIPEDKIVVSEKDKKLPNLTNAKIFD
jgi:dTDP-4-dehydrorhamnose 3,5-epimerase